MLRVPQGNPSHKRTLRGKYTFTQATAWSGFLDPDWDRSFDILPGTVMARKPHGGAGEIFTPFTGAAGQKPFGLSALYVAPSLGINEVTDETQNLFTVWVGGEQAYFEVLKPAFDPNGTYVLGSDGSQRMLTGNSHGLLTTTGVTEFNAVAELIDVPSPDKIGIRLNRFDIAATTPPAGGS